MIVKMAFIGLLGLALAGCAGPTRVLPSKQPPGAKPAIAMQATMARRAPLKRRPRASSPFTLRISADKSVYERNDATVLRVTASRNCKLIVVNVDETGVASVLFPNAFQTRDVIKAGTPLILGGPDSRFKLRLRDSGTEKVMAGCRALMPAASSSRKPVFTRATILLRVK